MEHQQLEDDELLNEYARLSMADPTDLLPAGDSRRRMSPGEWLRWCKATPDGDLAPLACLGEATYPKVDVEERGCIWLDVPALEIAIPLGTHPQQVSQSYRLW